ncbi:hypothetical protein RUM43_010500 [Polyplax serrata]|uniref:U3 small nucleolar RNA-associated protein 6-like protein n=1 Tax=Polyplax serrata TaxID=468196 RepID=A0AAN8S0J0_POLSC
MAEFVEFRCEEWVSELESLEKIQLFEPKEIKSLVTKRREFEYKIERRSKSKEDFLRYIQFEVDFLRIINARREKTGINANKASIEHKQINRIIRLFKQIIFRHPDDIKLWMSLFKFCSDVKQHSIVSKMLVRMLQHNSDKEDLWVYAAQWTMENEKSIANARQFLTKGLRHHPSSEKLYLELFRIELEHMKKKIKVKELASKNNKWEPNEITENIICGKLVEVIYKTATKILESAEFKVDLLNVAKNYSDAIDIQNKILNDLINAHSKEEVTWNAIAKREYDGFSCDWSILKSEGDAMDTAVDEEEKNGEKSPLRGRIQKSIDVYEAAIKKLNTDKMWNYYLDHVMEVYTNSTLKPKLPIFKSRIFQNAMEGALNSNHLTEKYIMNWIDTLKKSEKQCTKLEELLLKGVMLYPGSLPLWHARIRYHLSLDEGEKGKELFKEAVTKVTDCVPLWELVIEYCKLKKTPDIEEIFKDGIRRRGRVAQAIKPLYLEWLAETKGVEETRRVFETSEILHPPCLELYRVMVKVETKQSDCDNKRVRRCFELATLYFGREDTSIWLDFINWEMKEGDAAKVHEIHSAAMKSLTPEKADEFMTEYNFIKLNFHS